MGNRSIGRSCAGKIVVLDDVACRWWRRRIQSEDFGVVLGLLQAIAGRSLVGLGLDDGQSDVTGVAEQEVGELLLETTGLAARDDDPTVGERRLLGVEVRARRPSRPLPASGRTSFRQVSASFMDLARFTAAYSETFSSLQNMRLPVPVCQANLSCVHSKQLAYRRNVGDGRAVAEALPAGKATGSGGGVQGTLRRGERETTETGHSALFSANAENNAECPVSPVGAAYHRASGHDLIDVDTCLRNRSSPQMEEGGV